MCHFGLPDRLIIDATLRGRERPIAMCSTTPCLLCRMPILQRLLKTTRVWSAPNYEQIEILVSQLVNSDFLSYQINISHQPTLFFSNNKSASTTSHNQPNRALVSNPCANVPMISPPRVLQNLIDLVTRKHLLSDFSG